MAMDVAAGALRPVLSKLGDLLVGEYNLEKRVKKGIKSLETELTIMHVVLRKVGDVPSDQLDEQVRIWAAKVRELSYYMEDAIDIFIVKVDAGCEHAIPKNRVKKFLKKTTRLFSEGKALHAISNAIQEAQDLAKELGDLRQRYGLDVHDNGARVAIDPRLISMYKDVSELVGIDHARDELIGMLAQGDDGSKSHLRIVSIVGFGGLGKTTLARLVYENIKQHFSCTAFVSVSQHPDLKKILRDMLYELSKEKYANIDAARDEKQLIDELNEYLKNKRYLIIIDDIWDEKTWRFIECSFSKNRLGSRVITTTRKIDVSKACCSSRDDMIYKMKPLSDDDSRRLFHKRIFSHNNTYLHEFEEVSDDILKKCGGVPLAITAIASLLASNQQIKTVDQWYNLLNSFGRGLAEGNSVDDMKRILSLSYYDLPSYLKTCLLYLSVFPEDYIIEKDRLIWRWVAEGFVQGERQELRLAELGESYFNELINRSLIQSVDIDGEGRARACRVHDMVLDLICSLSTEENFITILDGIKRRTPYSQSKVRRLSIQKSMEGFNSSQINTASMLLLRSCTIFDRSINQLTPLSSFEVLRVLDLQGCDLGKNQHKIKNVGSLLHLRYLGLRDTHVSEVPTEKGKLGCLQTLDLRRAGLKALPLSVVQLRHLLRLCVDGTTKLPVGLWDMVSLEEWIRLDVVNFSQDDVKEFGRLSEFRVLQFGWSESDESISKAFVESLCNFRKLQSLEISAKGGCVDLLRGGWAPPSHLRRFALRESSMTKPKCIDSFATLPKWIDPSSLTLLSTLRIWVNEVQWEDIQVLGMLPALCSVWLGATGHIEDRRMQRYMITPNTFPRARECMFYNFVMVPSMFPQGAMPMVQVLRFCFRARDYAAGNLDLCMSHLPSLERVDVHLSRGKASDEDMEEAEDVLRVEAKFHPNRPILGITRW